MDGWMDAKGVSVRHCTISNTTNKVQHSHEHFFDVNYLFFVTDGEQGKC